MWKDLEEKAKQLVYKEDLERIDRRRGIKSMNLSCIILNCFIYCYTSWWRMNISCIILSCFIYCDRSWWRVNISCIILNCFMYFNTFWYYVNLLDFLFNYILKVIYLFITRIVLFIPNFIQNISISKLACVRFSVRPFLCPSVSPSVTLFCKNNKFLILRQQINIPIWRFLLDNWTRWLTRWNSTSSPTHPRMTY